MSRAVNSLPPPGTPTPKNRDMGFTRAISGPSGRQNRPPTSYAQDPAHRLLRVLENGPSFLKIHKKANQ